MVLQKSLKEVKSLKVVSRIFKAVHKTFKDVYMVFQGGLEGVSRKFHECFKKVSRVFQDSSKED